MSVRIYGLSIGLVALGCSSSPATTAESEGVATSAVNPTSSKATASVAQAANARPRRALSVSSGASHTCAVLDHHETRCWGVNPSGEIGNGSMGYGVTYPPTNTVAGFPTAKLMSAGGGYTCGLSQDGFVDCWGTNAGNLGIGDPPPYYQLTPAPVTLPTLAKRLYANVNGFQTCVILQDGDVYCWGFNDTGQLGIPGPSTSTPTARVPLRRNATELALGNSYTCALLRNGDVDCWGTNFVTGVADEPGSRIELPGPAIGVSSGVAHICATLETGDVYCWGNNVDGEVGIGVDGFEQGTVLTPTKVNLLGPAASVSCGSDDTCAVLTDGRVECWGINLSGQLGTGDGVYSYNSPQLIDIGFAVESISSGFFHRCALSTTGDVKCWGDNYANGLGLSCGEDCPNTVLLTPAQLDKIAF